MLLLLFAGYAEIVISIAIAIYSYSCYLTLYINNIMVNHIIIISNNINFTRTLIFIVHLISHSALLEITDIIISKLNNQIRFPYVMIILSIVFCNTFIILDHCI